MLRVRDATVRFGDVAALDGLDLDVEPGAIVAVVGPSGSGKSTLLRAVAGLQPLDSGRIELCGRDVAGVPPHRRGVGLMFQDHALFPHRDVGANVAFGLRMRGSAAAAIDARVAELLEAVGLAGAERRGVDTLSGGEQQRVALARALAPEPALLMLDEPLGSLDRPLRERLVRDLRAVFTTLGQTVVAVTHDHAEAFALADEVAVMSAGRVLQTGPPERVWQAPASAMVARVLGFTNLVEAVIEDGRARTAWGTVPLSANRTGPATLLVGPDAIRLDPAGSLRAVVVARVFAGSDVRCTVRPPAGADLDVNVALSDAPAPGDTVDLSVDPAGVLVLGPER